MKKYTFLEIQEKGKLIIVTINNPAKMNALSLALLQELESLWKEIDAHPTAHVVILEGVGKVFVAGADIKTMSDFSAEQAKEWAHYGAYIFRTIELSPKITIASINGYALGGGLELAMACDIRLASKDAKMGQPEVSLGIIPGFSGTQRLQAHVGIGKAKELIYTGEIINADEALRIGLVNAVFEHEVLSAEAVKMADKILTHSAAAQRMAKTAINTSATAHLFQGIELEEQLFARCFSHPDAREGMQAFLKKEKPKFQ